MKIGLLVIDGVHAGETITVEGIYLLVGRGPQCHVRPNSQDVSLRHCHILSHEGVCYLRDLDSKTGTFINDRRLRGEIEMRDGDMLRVGPLTFLVQLGTASPGYAPVPAPLATDEPPEEQPLADENDYVPDEMMSSPVDTTEMPALDPYDAPLDDHAYANGNGHGNGYGNGYAEARAEDYQYGLQANPEPEPEPEPVAPPVRQPAPPAVPPRPLPVVQGRRVPAPAPPQQHPANGNGVPNGARPRVTRVTMNGMVRRPPT